MAHARECPRLVDEPRFQGFAILDPRTRESAFEHLESHASVQLRVISEIYATEATGSDRGDDEVLSDGRPPGKWRLDLQPLDRGCAERGEGRPRSPGLVAFYRSNRVGDRCPAVETAIEVVRHVVAQARLETSFGKRE